jgi:pilus assembly protein FimV
MVRREGAREVETSLSDMDFDLGGLEESAAAEETPAPEAASVAAEPAPESAAKSLDFDLGDFHFGEEAEQAAAQPAVAEQKEEGALDFELGELNLDMDEGAGEPAALDLGTASAEEADFGDLGDLGDLDLGDLDAVGTKLDLARAYVDMGEPDSARSILSEVLAEGDDKQRSQAQELLGQLS